MIIMTTMIARIICALPIIGSLRTWLVQIAPRKSLKNNWIQAKGRLSTFDDGDDGDEDEDDDDDDEHVYEEQLNSKKG